MNFDRHREFDQFADDLLRESATRIVIIIGSSKIDDILVQIISKYLLPKIAGIRDQDELLEGDKPLSTFSSRMKIVYRLGIIDKSLYKLLDKIRNIRNYSAHNCTFDATKSPIRELLNDLFSVVPRRKSYRMIKERYFQNQAMNHLDILKCSFLAVCILLEAVNTKIKMVKENHLLLKITAR